MKRHDNSARRHPARPTRKRSFLTAAVVASFAAGAAPADTVTDAMANAYNTSGLLEQNRAVLRAADEDVAQSISSLRPVVNWTAGVNRNFGVSRTTTDNALLGRSSRVSPTVSNTSSIGLSASLLVYDFGRSRAMTNLAKSSVLAARDGLVGAEQQVLLRAATAFWEVRRARHILNLRRNNLDLIEQELQAAKDRLEVGAVTRTDVDLAEARLAQARSDLTLAEGNLDISQEEYRAAVGSSHEEELSPPDALPELPPSIEEATRIALDHHPELLAQKHRLDSAELQIAAARAAMRPEVRMTGEVGYQSEFGNSDYARQGSVGIGVTMPIYSGGKHSSLVRQAQTQLDQQRALLTQLKREVRQNVSNAYVQLNTAEANVEAGQSRVRATRRVFDGIREEATMGTRTTFDLLEAEQDLLDARTRLVEAAVDRFIASYKVLASTGDLTATALELPVLTYDPDTYYRMAKDAPGNPVWGAISSE